VKVQEALAEIARTPSLLVCCDYDGTLAPIVENPDEALPHRESIAALRALASFPDTHVAVVSGRSLRDLATLSRLPAEIHLVGSHGSEFDAGFIRDLTDEQIALRLEIVTLMKAAAATDPGFIVEQKPASIAFHYRNAAPENADVAVEEIRRGLAALANVQVKEGKKVIELAVVHTDKGSAIERLRRQVGADAVLFMGDDVTDEDGFAVLSGPDVGVKIGDGRTAAEYRLDDTAQTAQTLALLCEMRRGWLEGANSPPIEQHSLLSDQRTIALVTPDARVTWMCHPRIDSPAVFAELVGGPKAGYFAVRPDGSDEPISQRYVGDTLILETRWADLTVTDYLDLADPESVAPAGRTDLVRVLDGVGVAHIEFAPRLDYGRAPTSLYMVGESLTIGGANQSIALHSHGVSWVITDDGVNQTATGSVELGDRPVVLRLAFGDEGDPIELDEPAHRLRVAEYWDSWSASLTLPPIRTELVRRSALAIKALCHEPTGAIVAAATTSLPEVAGGVRNWDYRYCWPRDAALAAASLISIGSTSESIALLDWLHDRVAHLSGPEHLRPIYAVSGDEFLPEAVLPTLHGYLGSRPVRIGNAADQQVQLDVFGPIVDLVNRMASAGESISQKTWDLVTKIVGAVEQRWREPDHGIWEERRRQRHHVHSKVMCWMAVDRAVAIAKQIDVDVPETWFELRATIANDVLNIGWNAQVGAFTGAYGDDDLDAAALWIGLSGLLPATDPRFIATVNAIERDLRRGPMVYRYRLDDGLPGDEGGFLICVTWLIEAYVAMGRDADARTLFDRYCDLAGDTGLLSEQFDPASGRMLGNHPQTYSHLGLINAAIALSRSAGDHVRPARTE
jgi:trehalose 6-phosphate phosphatase